MSDAVAVAIVTMLGPVVTIIISHVLSSRTMKRNHTANTKTLKNIEVMANGTLEEARKHILILEHQIEVLVREIERIKGLSEERGAP